MEAEQTTETYVKGQLVKIYRFNLDDEKWTWRYGIVKDTYDDCIVIEDQYSGNLMHRLPNCNEKSIAGDRHVEIHALHQNGKVVMAKRGLFGRYKFAPKEND